MTHEERNLGYELLKIMLAAHYGCEEIDHWLPKFIRMLLVEDCPERPKDNSRKE